MLKVANNSCPCPEIPKLNLTNLPQQGCFKIHDRFRYKCMDGYLRKAGTSTLIKCENPGAQWSKPSLVCIPDPRITTTQPPKATSTTTTESHTDISSYSVSTSAITTASTAQMMQNSSTVLEQGTSTQTTTHAEPVMETTGQTDTIKNATHSALEIDAATTTAATVITVLLVTLCTAGIVLLYQRRRREHTPVNQDPEELCTLNA
ncbi:interleukin-15 receptor subunit alpha isoform X4 [Astatotilapia calliptera]|uniref:interleukin-15 receptor subunit alpha isoform X4 n=1 Tax=Astatotilapia calliptera TaxID=8154 RepID=UPI000E42B535|nr:interleukin-15 receptor subunit alpha isoform X4 [Astatotilapia calliptera]